MPTQQGKCNPNFTKSQNNLKRKQNETTLHHKKHHQCVFTYTNYSLFAAHRIWESLYFNHNNFIQNEKTAGTRHLRTLLCTLINLGADHSTSEGGGGGWVILKKNILQVHMHKKKNYCTRPSCQKKFMHVQWAGKKILARCSLSWHIKLYQSADLGIN